MNKLFLSLLFLLNIVILSGCGAMMGADNPGSEGYYYAEFNDVPIPNELAENKSDTYITYVAGGLKCGQQIFEGRVEKNSLLTAMKHYMQKDGWSPRAASYYGNKSVLTYEKNDKMATLLITDGTIFCTMQVNVSSRLSSSDVFHDPIPSSSSSSSSSSGSSSSGSSDSGGVEKYSSGGFSSNSGSGGAVQEKSLDQ